MLTEEEAETKWCPFVRFNTNANNRWTGADEQDANPHFARCIASQCMAWRWADEIELAVRSRWAGGGNKKPGECDDPLAAFVPASEDNDAHWRESDEKLEARQRDLDANRRGYCGLAGAPPK